MSDKKIFDKNFRTKFLNNANFSQISEYLKSMEKLSKKGGEYLKIYNEDVSYVLNSDNILKDSRKINIFGEMTLNLDTMTERMCDTIGYLDRIENVTLNTYIVSDTRTDNHSKSNNSKSNQSNKINQSNQSNKINQINQINQNLDKSFEIFNKKCLIKIEELEKIEDILSDYKLNQQSIIKPVDWQKAINRFIELIIICGKEVTQKPHILFNSMSYTMICNLITKTEKYLDFAYMIFSKLLKSEVIIDRNLIKNFNSLRQLKKTDPKKYSLNKKKLILQELEDRNDRDKNSIFVSKFVEKIINAKSQQNKAITK